MQARALLFDMDGTLIDSSAAILGGWNKWAARYGFDGAQVYEYSHGRKAAATIAHFLPGADRATIEADADAIHDDFAALSGTTTAIPGARELLGQLHPREWAVVTSAPVALARLSLSAAGLPLPEIIIGADLVTHGKPDPEGFRLAMRPGPPRHRLRGRRSRPPGGARIAGAGRRRRQAAAACPSHRPLDARLCRGRTAARRPAGAALSRGIGRSGFSAGIRRRNALSSARNRAFRPFPFLKA